MPAAGARASWPLRCLTIELSGRPPPPLRIGEHAIHCEHDAPTMTHGLLQRVVRQHSLLIRSRNDRFMREWLSVEHRWLIARLSCQVEEVLAERWPICFKDLCLDDLAIFVNHYDHTRVRGFVIA